MDDAEAYIALALNNMQGELHPLEIGLHALKSGLSVRDYAKQTGMKPTPLAMRMQAAKVADACSDIGTARFPELWSHLAEIHPAPKWLWPALVIKLQAE